MLHHSMARVAFFAFIVACGLSKTAGVGEAQNASLVSGDPRDDLRPWGVATGAEWLSAYPLFNPLLSKAGVTWLRAFYEWQVVEPKRGYFNWASTDRLVANAKANNIQLASVLAYFPTWASADGGTRSFPIKDVQYWRDYVRASVERYHSDIKYWEVWNEFNGSFAPNGTPEMYAELVREASITAKKIDSTAKIGMSVASFDVNFLDRAIKAGAADHFDFLCVHPYEKFEALRDNGEVDFLSMTTTLRQMLAANRQNVDTPLWITELGVQAPVSADQFLDSQQAVLLAKAYILSIAAGFKRVFWFEARGPADKQRDFGLIRPDMTLRPSHAALKTMIEVLGSQPVSLGWVNLGDGGYGFVFDTGGQPALAAWAPIKREINITFPHDIRIVELNGSQASLRAGTELTLTDTPLLILDVPSSLVEAAKTNNGKSYPWSRHYGQARTVTVRLQAINQEDGLKQINSSTTMAVKIGDQVLRQTDFSRPDKEGHYVYFLVDPEFVPFGTRELEITAVVKRTERHKLAGTALNYESQHGYTNVSYLNIPEGDDWQELKWKISDADFLSRWGWNFRLEAISSPNEFLVKEVRVEKP